MPNFTESGNAITCSLDEQNYQARININDFSIIDVNLPPRIHSYIIEWALLHKAELLDNWNKAKDLKNPKKIKPLV